MHVNKVHHVTTITRVAEDLGEDEDWLCGRRQRNGNRGRRDLGLSASETTASMAFTDFGIENLIELIKMHKDDPTLLKRYQPE